MELDEILDTFWETVIEVYKALEDGDYDQKTYMHEKQGTIVDVHREIDNLIKDLTIPEVSNEQKAKDLGDIHI